MPWQNWNNKKRQYPTVLKIANITEMCRNSKNAQISVFVYRAVLKTSIIAQKGGGA